MKNEIEKCLALTKNAKRHCVVCGRNISGDKNHHCTKEGILRYNRSLAAKNATRIITKDNYDTKLEISFAMINGETNK